MIKSFAPLKIKLILTGGYTMDYKIVKKAPFTVVGVSRVFSMKPLILKSLNSGWTLIS